MTFRQFIFIMGVVTVSLWLSWWWVVLKIDPFASDWLGFVLFYLILFLALIGTFTILGVFLRRLRMHDELVFHLVMLSSRQSILLAGLVIAFILLQSQRFLAIWNALLLILSVVVIEFIVLSRQVRRTSGSAPVFDTKKLGDIGISPVFQRREIGEDSLTFEDPK